MFLHRGDNNSCYPLWEDLEFGREKLKKFILKHDGKFSNLAGEKISRNDYNHLNCNCQIDEFISYPFYDIVAIVDEEICIDEEFLNCFFNGSFKKAEKFFMKYYEFFKDGIQILSCPSCQSWTVILSDLGM